MACSVSPACRPCALANAVPMTISRVVPARAGGRFATTGGSAAARHHPATTAPAPRPVRQSPLATISRPSPAAPQLRPPRESRRAAPAWSAVRASPAPRLRKSASRDKTHRGYRAATTASPAPSPTWQCRRQSPGQWRAPGRASAINHAGLCGAGLSSHHSSSLAASGRSFTASRTICPSCIHSTRCAIFAISAL